MGEVYKARDTRLDRMVAIKTLPEALAADPQFRERFDREARTISQLDHQNICALYDVGEEHGTSYLVMQYLEGETLAARLVHGPLPIGEALTIAIQISTALDKAHRAGIVHRDLKPGNVMLTKSGAKLLDFGLAKENAAVAGLSMLPTNQANLTAQGTILGTFQYMAPEQVEGKEADARTDIFAFGTMLYEMVAGRPAFQGKTQASLIGSILRDDPMTVVDVVPSAPPALARVIRTCLAKNPDDRCQTAHDVTLQLQWIAEGGSQAGIAAAPAAAPRRTRERLAWGVAALGAAGAVALAAVFALRAPEPRRVFRFDVMAPEGVIGVDAPRLSPDGKYLAFNATDAEGKTQIWVRSFDALVAQPLAGTEGASRPFWSPDSAVIGFMAEGKLKKIAVTGGPAQKVADAPTGADGSWSAEGVILYDGRTTDPIMRVAAAGGTPVVAVKPDTARSETAVGWPEFLPDGRHFLYLAMNQKPEDNGYRIGSLDSSESQPLGSAQTQVAYSASGHLLFVRDRTLVAQPFDAKAMKILGEPVPLAERIGTDSVGLARFSVSRDGTLAYRVGDVGRRLTWVDRTGREIETLGDPGEYGNPALSRNGARLAYSLADPRTAKIDIWIRDLARGVSSRFTFIGNNDVPLWSPDGTTVVFGSNRSGQQDLYEKSASGQGEDKVFFKSDQFNVPADWSRDGRYVLVQSRNANTSWDVLAVPVSGDRKPIPVVVGPFAQLTPVFSPDGRFVAYTSDESGRNEIYVQTFPEPTGKWQVSNTGGTDAKWRADGKEITYRAPDQKLTAVDVAGGSNFQAGIPRALFLGRTLPGNARNKYVGAADGQRFLFVAPLGRDALVPTTVVLNWSAALAR